MTKMNCSDLKKLLFTYYSMNTFRITSRIGFNKELENVKVAPLFGRK